jgi:O-antigen ligase
MALSAPGALVLGLSFELLVDNFAKTVLMFVVMAGAVRGERDVERLIAAYLFGATVYAAVVFLRFDVGAGDEWRLGRLYYYDANDFATFVISALPFGLYFAQRRDRPIARLAAFAALAVLSAAFVRSGSRGGFLALLATSGFIVLRYNAISVAARLSAVAVVALVLIGTASERYWGQMSTILSDADYNHTQESGRIQIWRRGVGYMLQYPVFGVGPNNFGTAEGTLSPFADRQQYGIGVRWNAPHNSFIQAGAELGIPGLVLFAGMIGSAFAVLRRLSAAATAGGAGGRTSELVHALTASLIGFVVGAFFLSLAYSEILYTLVAFTVALQKVQRLRARGPAAS